MPFRGGFALHATIHPEKLGKKATLGCIGLAEEDARDLFDLIKKTETEVTVKDTFFGRTYQHSYARYAVRLEILKDKQPGIEPSSPPPFSRYEAQRSLPDHRTEMEAQSQRACHESDLLLAQLEMLNDLASTIKDSI